LTKTLFLLAEPGVFMVQNGVHHVKKSLSCALLIIVLVSGLLLVFVANFGVAYASTDVSGVIGSGTTWTKANSPYSLVGNVLVGNGATLTIEAGATINLNDFCIMVNSTLRVQGSGSDKIHFKIFHLRIENHKMHGGESIVER
jgi:hypothetical protein